MRERHGLARPIHTLPQPNKDFSRQRPRYLHQHFALQSHNVLRLIQQRGIEQRVSGDATGLFATRCLFGQLAEMLSHARIEVLLQPGQQLVSQTIASQRDILIGRVLTEVLAEFDQELFDPVRQVTSIGRMSRVESLRLRDHSMPRSPVRPVPRRM